MWRGMVMGDEVRRQRMGEAMLVDVGLGARLGTGRWWLQRRGGGEEG